ncbi:MAG: glycoside hydrolase [Cellulophaga sp.]
MNKIGFLFLVVVQLSCVSQNNEKINGVSFVASRGEVKQEQVTVLKNNYVNHAAVMPLGFMKGISSPEIAFNMDNQWFGETNEGVKQYVQSIKKQHIKVMMKPQIWVRRGEFTGTIKMNSEADWKVLEVSYEKFILNYASIAQEMQVSIFCIGTELELFVKNRPAYWTELITRIKSVYKGKLTYAANWDEFKRTHFWEDIDYIGVDAYFPLSQEKTPTIEELKIGWQKHKKVLLALSIAKNKPILFTEYGYRSTDYTARKPWLVERNNSPANLLAQSNATAAIIEEFWKEEWFAGGYVWKWFVNHEKSGGKENNRFTPQNKPAQDVLKRFYKTF